MKQFRHKLLSWITACLAAALTANAMAEDLSSPKLNAFVIQKNLGDTIRPLVKAFDDKAEVAVSLRMEKSTAKKSPPFLYNNHEEGAPEAASRIKGVNVVILSSMDSIPSRLKEMIRNAASSASTNVVISLEKAPPLDAKVKRAHDINQDNAVLADLFSAKNLDEFKRRISDLTFYLTAIVATFMALMTTLLTLIILNLRKSIRVVDSGMRELTNAIEKGEGLGSSFRQSKEEVSSRRTASESNSPESDNVFAKMADDSLINLLADCYWGEFDRYAAFIWRRIPLETRMSILKKTPFLKDYVWCHSRQAEENLGLENDPAYLDPLDLWRFDNSTVADLIRITPGLYQLLPELRKQRLALTPKERLALTGRTRNFDAAKAAFGKLTPSAPRVLQSVEIIPITSSKDEMELMDMRRDMDARSKQQTMTLIWALDLGQSDLTEILKGYSAKELATAWIGPEELLLQLANAIPPKKLELIQTYAKTIQPSRASIAFERLHHDIVSQLLNRESGSKGGKEAEDENRNVA